jgi:hypothetical protein
MSRSYNEMIAMESEFDDVLEVVRAYIEKFDLVAEEVLEKLRAELGIGGGR